MDFLRSRGNGAAGIFAQLPFKSAVSFFQRGWGGEADVLYLQMAEVNLQCASAACVGGGSGRGMTIGFREQAMGTDGPWLPPKIPLRKMAGLTYFWTHHAVQMYCRERGSGSAFISYNLWCFGSTLWD